MQRHYLPDIPTYCELSHGIARELALEHQVEVFTSSPSYRSIFEGSEPPAVELMDGVTVHRLKPISKLPAMIGFTISAARRLQQQRKQFDVVLVVSEPPVVLPFAIVAVASRSAATIQLLQDIHPEAGEVAGMLPNPMLRRILFKMDQWTAGRADRTVVLSEDMANSYSSRQPKDIRIINNYRLESEVEPPAEGLIDESLFNVTFAGNVGKFQNLDVLLDAAHLVQDLQDVVIHILGSGPELDRITERVAREALRNVKIHGHVPRTVAQGFMQHSNVGVVTLEREIHRYSYPSKTMAYVEAECELLAIVEPDSSLALDVREHGLGAVAEPHGADVATAIRQLHGSTKTASTQHSSRTPFGREETLESWVGLIGELL